MKVRTIIFGCIIACILILLAPNISAIELRTTKDNINGYNENGLLNAIKERIEKLKAQNPKAKLTLNYEDPDGPFEGGLDDPYDWMNLYFGIIYGSLLAILVKQQAFKEAFATGNIFKITSCIIKYGLYTVNTLIGFGEAFDIINPDDDGY
jgi:hypothetical protein